MMAWWWCVVDNQGYPIFDEDYEMFDVILSIIADAEMLFKLTF